MKPERGRLTIVGCGPGGAEYLTRQALSAVAGAEVLCGPRFLLDLFPEAGAERVVTGAGARQVAGLVRSRMEEGSRVVLLVTGDPGLHSLAGPVTRLLGRERVQVVPGISSLQLAFARLGLPWENARIFSLHGVSGEEARLVLGALAAVSTAAVLCSPVWTPGKILGALRDTAGQREVHVFWDLGRPTEGRMTGTVDELAGRFEGSGRSVLVLTEAEESDE
ncbi:MAG: precorrin-6y C5,15-methyltransferase (decarboxylating) subunit CbiE [Thermoanaerobacterales bacterium]|nr:precorrin-6y C5,15-methyltransferase (decarboxylating) subunit CbiE [Bacillota bacterium]MDI6906961.1 precorrin-6y C5,15-methyltransferase (decarboxylating) subunit CbiE [Thermoanaerobacterales bacterium]